MNSNSYERIQSGSPLNLVLTRLRGVEESSSGYEALCPAHDDSSPSLSVQEGEDGKALLHCHAGCKTKEVVQALGLEMGDLFPPDLDDSWKPWDGTEVEAYTYTDKVGNALFQVVRYEMQDESHPAYGEKKFLQRAHAPGHEDAGNNGCPPNYVWGRQDTSPVLYKLPAVANAIDQGETVYFVEGEKDVHTLLDEGLTATCNPGGAATGEDPGEKLTTRMIEPLRGANVVVIPDADEPGRQFAEAVASHLHPVAGQVRVVELPEVREGGDVTDYIENGHSVNDLTEIVGTIEPFEPPPETVEDLISRAEESGDSTIIFDYIDLLAEASNAKYHMARGKLKDATGINLNGLESARQEAIERLESQREERRRENERKKLDADGRPVVQLADERPSREIVDRAIEAFEAFNDPPSLFTRGEELVRVADGEDGKPVFESVGESFFDDQMTRAANFVEATSDGISRVDLPMRLTRRVQQHVDPPYLKAIRGVPFLRPDGTVVREPGYDHRTQILYRPAPDIEVPTVPKSPRGKDVKRAAKLLKEPFRDFPFVDQASRANAIAAMLTPVLRPLLDGANVPLVILDATKQGTGKTLLAHAVALSSTGRVPATMSAPSSNEEWRKQITAQFRKGESIIVVDNVKGRLSSSALERALTSRTWGDRILGESRQASFPADSLFIATGNNLRPRGEMTRRCILSRLDAKMVRPWQRNGFEHPQLREWIRSKRGDLVAALLTVVRSWIERGRPESDTEQLGSFERWASITGGVVHHIGIEGFLGNLSELYETASEEEHQWSRLLESIAEWASNGDKVAPFTTKELSEDLKGHVQGQIQASGKALESIRSDLPADIRERLQYGNPIAKSLGKMFGYREGRRFPGGWHIERVNGGRDGVKWTIQNGDSNPSRDNVTLDPSGSRDNPPPPSDSQEGGGSQAQEQGDLKSQSHTSTDEAPF
ncbi:hypothetical protein [Salinibacter ruber]|uniref:hypothetical protein n=1 Tax=Salinibacter ruber TaxID=146919 RepID=UPI00216935A1|nr:hypothetical protein [Salinibacter ruber]MCS4187849.1 hypothetical protein [Salinibacter ruber]